MTRKPINDAEKRSCTEARDKGVTRRRRAERDYAHLHFATHLLRGWGAKSAAVQASLALSATHAPVDWRRGEAQLACATVERIAIVFAIHRRLAATDEVSDQKPLPCLRRTGRPALTGREILEGGRLSDLLRLWRQLVLAEEAAERRRGQRRQKEGHCRGRRPAR